MTSALHFRAIIKIYNGNPYVLVNKSRAQTLQKDWARPMPVFVQINGQPKPSWKINMMPIGDGSFYLYLDGIVRKASQTKVGDIVEVDVGFDVDYRSGPAHPMPEWFRLALEQKPAARGNWDALAPSRQKEILRYFSRLKSDEARDRNSEKAIHVLSGKPGRFMARSWSNGS